MARIPALRCRLTGSTMRMPRPSSPISALLRVPTLRLRRNPALKPGTNKKCSGRSGAPRTLSNSRSTFFVFCGIGNCRRRIAGREGICQGLVERLLLRIIGVRDRTLLRIATATFVFWLVRPDLRCPRFALAIHVYPLVLAHLWMPICREGSLRIQVVPNLKPVLASASGYDRQIVQSSGDPTRLIHEMVG